MAVEFATSLVVITSQASLHAILHCHRAYPLSRLMGLQGHQPILHVTSVGSWAAPEFLDMTVKCGRALADIGLPAPI